MNPWEEWMYYDTPGGQQRQPFVHGITTTVDPTAGTTIGDYLCLSRVVFPSGGYEWYHYERHDYSLFSSSPDIINPPYNNQQFEIAGKRLKKKEIVDGNGNIQIIEFKYCLHDENYVPKNDGYFAGPRLISSGVLINPSIHTSTMYTPKFDQNHPRLEASPYYTEKPQNSQSGSPIFYTEVEENFLSGSGISNGKKIYYFDKMYAAPAANAVYMNYNYEGARSNVLVNLPNTLYGKQLYPPDQTEITAMSNQNFTYLAYPVGRFTQTSLKEGKLLGEVTLNANGNVLRKVENQYTSGEGIETTLFGISYQKFIDGNYSSDPQHHLELISWRKLSQQIIWQVVL